jgi:predicted enzyme related to lactoylglutathione lyase
MDVAMVVLVADDVPGLARFYEAVTGWERAGGDAAYVELRSPAGLRLSLAASTEYAASVGVDRVASRSTGPSGTELYLVTDDVERDTRVALASGGTVLDPPRVRAWGDTVAYVQDPAGNVCAFAQRVAPAQE